MRASHAVDQSSSSTGAVARLRELLARRASTAEPVENFAAFEVELAALFADARAEVLGRELERLDPRARVVEINGVACSFVGAYPKQYMTSAGKVPVTRSLFRAPGDDRAVCPMELRAGIVEGFWTPQAAMLSTWTVAHMTSQEAEELFRRAGGMTPSRSALDRLPKDLSSRFEARRDSIVEAVSRAEEIPENAATVGVSIDGVYLPMREGDGKASRDRARAKGKTGSGPTGFREVGNATLTLYDAEGERLKTCYVGRMPEAGMVTVKAMIAGELERVLRRRPELTVVGVADGAKANWTWMDAILPPGADQVLDYFHAVEHLKEALDAGWGAGTPKAKAMFEKLRHLLLEAHNGADSVINHVAYLHRKKPRSRKLANELRFFRRHRHRMRYARMQSERLPVGSGEVEAANKTLVGVRMKRSGARWCPDGGQAVLTFRALAKSRRFDAVWSRLISPYRVDVFECGNVIRLGAGARR